MSVRTLMDLLDSHNVPFTRIHHPPAYSAQEVAASAHVSGYEMAKTVVVKADGKTIMAVLPANYQIDMPRLKEVTGARTLELAREEELAVKFPDCETGAVPPFGFLYGMEEYVDHHLALDTEIAFNACEWNELIRISYRDFVELSHPKTADFAHGPM